MLLSFIIFQAVIDFTFEDIICRVADKKYFTNVDTYITDDSVNSVFINFTIVSEIPETIEVN